MSEIDKLELCLRQHGKEAQQYAEQAILVGNVCLIQNFAFKPDLLEALDRLFQNGIINDYAGICDIKIFRLPRHYLGFYKEQISIRGIVSLFEFCLHLYPGEIGTLGQYQYWDELDIYRRAEVIDSVVFSSRIRDMFGYQGYPEGLEEQAEQLEQFIAAIRPELFYSKIDKIMMYCMVNDNDENCSFAPYIFVGRNGCLLVVARKWVL